MATTNTGCAVDPLSAASVLNGTPATRRDPQVGRPTYLDCSTCDGDGEVVCCGGPCTVRCEDCQGTGIQHCDGHSRSRGWALFPAVVVIEGYACCETCAVAARSLADTCADCGGSTAAGTGDPHVCSPAHTCIGCGETRPTLAYTVTDHSDKTHGVQYCSGCAELARCDWNGETKSIAPKLCDHCDEPAVVFPCDAYCARCAERMSKCDQCGGPRPLATLDCEPCGIADQEIRSWDDAAACAADALGDRQRDEAFVGEVA